MDTNRARICVPVCVKSAHELEETIARAAAAGDLVELRFDCLEPSELEQGILVAHTLIDRLGKPTIVTFRATEQGGERALDRESRIKFWLFDKRQYAALYDMELDLALGLDSTEVAQYLLNLNWENIVCSHHDFVGVPSDLDQIYGRLAGTPARILKIAVRVGDVVDCLPVFQLLDRARREGRELIAIAMGTAGIVTRILGPSRGAFLTYGALETESATAPGQLTAKELRDLYRIEQLSPKTEIMGLVGLPVTHSVSPHILNAAFAARDVDAVYIPFEVRDVPAFIKRMVNPRTREIVWNLSGLSVTAPHKAAVIAHLDWIEPAAEEIGAVNTIVVKDDLLLGYNTDATAVLKPVLEKLGPLRDARCAIIGAGGVASAALWSLKQEGAKTTVFARDPRKGTALAEKYGAQVEPLARASFEGFDLVINATPLGTRGLLEDETVTSAIQLSGARLAYDLVYNPNETRFMREARDAGCDTIGGLEMLVLQAAEQFRLWTKAEAPIDVMRDAATSAVRSQAHT
jgi:3-dehydroquinate dehydratase/shikimate dehydrogenase